MENGLALREASNKLKNDNEIISVAVKNNRFVLDYLMD
jgi:hypothetical protein